MTNSEKVIAQLSGKFGTAVKGQYEAVRLQYYDYVRLNTAGTNRLTFFSNPIGAVDPTSNLAKTLEETNIRRSGELDERFAIMQIRTYAYILPTSRQQSGFAGNVNNASAVVQDFTPVHQAIANLNYQGVLSVNFGQKNFIQIEQPLQTCPPGYGPSIRTISSNATGGTIPPISQFTTQSVDPRDVYVMDPAIFVEKGQTFSANIDYFGWVSTQNGKSVTIPQVNGYSINVNVGVILDGYVIRPVQ